MAWFGNDAGSAACRAHLVATNLVARDENVGVENKFSRLRRFALSKSLQKKRVDVSGMQQFWVGLTTRVSWLFGKAYAKLYPDLYGLDQANTAAEQEKGEKGKKEETRRRRRKPYTAVDAYLREQRAKGSSRAGWQSMQDIMKGYNLLKRAKFLGTYTQRAEQATVRRQMGDPNPWGDQPRGPPGPPSTTALAVAVPIEDLAALPTVHIAQYPKEVILGVIPKVRGARWKRKALEKKNMERDIEQLVSYNKPGSAGSAVARKIHDEVAREGGREIKSNGLSLDPIGIQDRAFAHFSFDLIFAAPAALKLIRLDPRFYMKGAGDVISPLFQALRKMWRRLTETIQHTECEEIKRAPMPDNASRICHIANRCVCTLTEFGTKISVVHQSFLDAVARQFPRGKHRQSLKSGNAVALFIEEIDPPTPWTFTFIHLSDVNESIAGEGWVINCVEFEAISNNSEVKKLSLIHI